jgi:hypothetical protein
MTSFVVNDTTSAITINQDVTINVDALFVNKAVALDLYRNGCFGS